MSITQKNYTKRSEFMDNRSKEMARLACAALEDKKAEDLKVINIGDVSVLADYYYPCI